MSITSEWNLKQKSLKEIIRKPERFNEAKELLLEMHKSVHFSEKGNTQNPTLMDDLWEGLQDNEFAVMPTEKDETIAWGVWHITRIEDLTINILVDESEQILNDKWLLRLNTKRTDTGNAMNDDEIMDFSKGIDIDALKAYRIAVGQKTQEVLSSLKVEDMKRKVKHQQLAKILNEHGVLDHPDSLWLLDFWGKKDVSGIILMPITRHQIVHINAGFNIKQALHKKKEFYRI